MTQYSSLLRGLAAGSAFLFLFAPTAFAAEQTVEAPSVDARAWILMDYASGKVLKEGNADVILVANYNRLYRGRFPKELQELPVVSLKEQNRKRERGGKEHDI